MNPQRVDQCRDLLIEVARKGKTITYGDLATRLGITHHRGTQPYLDAVYNGRQPGQPDLTLLVVYARKRYGRYNSRGNPARSVPFDPNNPQQVAAYDQDRQAVYRYWA